VESLPLWANGLIFLAAAAAVWIAGISLSNQTDVLSTRLHLGTALGGVVLLAVATNLPELAITASAALSGNIGVAVGNILGGIAIQTVVLVVLDAFGKRGGRPLTYRAASLVLVVEGLVVMAVLVVVVAGSQLPDTLIAFRLGPAAVLIAALWVVGLLLIRRAHQALPWHESGEAPDNQPEPQGHSRHKTEEKATEKGISTAKSVTIFGVAALVTLAGGVALERSGDAIAGDIGLSGVLFGATVLAAPPRCPRSPPGCSRSAWATTSSPSATSSAATPSCPCCSSWRPCCRGRPCCPRPKPPTSTSRRSGCCSPPSTSRACSSAHAGASPGWAWTPSSCWCSTSSACSACSP
jgi:cation:H+ antiporter